MKANSKILLSGIPGSRAHARKSGGKFVNESLLDSVYDDVLPDTILLQVNILPKPHFCVAW